MDSWSTTREPEKPKTLTGQRALAVLTAEGVYMKTIQHAEAAALIDGRDAPLTRHLFLVARTIRELLDLMPGAKP